MNPFENTLEKGKVSRRIKAKQWIHLKLLNFSGSNGTVKAAPVPLGQDCYRWKENWSLIFLTWRFFITFRKSTSECIFFPFQTTGFFCRKLPSFFCNLQKVYDDLINVQQVSFWWLCAEKNSFWYFFNDKKISLRWYLMSRKSASKDFFAENFERFVPQAVKDWALPSFWFL